MPFQIEKNVPMPERGGAHRGRPSKYHPTKYPWAEMEVGDSFFSPSDGAAPATMRDSASRAGKRLGRRFAVHLAEGGVRVWRTG